MRIGIDVRYLSHGLIGGVHRYVLDLVPALIKIGMEHQFFLYADTKAPFELRDLPDNVTVRFLPWHHAVSTIYHDLFMWRMLEKDKLDVVHFPANYGFGPKNARTVVTLHDEINILPLHRIIRGHPKRLDVIAMMTYLHYLSVAALHRVHLIITDSEYSRDKILKNSPIAIKDIKVVSAGLASHFRRIQDEKVLEQVRKKYNLDKPFMLGDALKNSGAAVNAWRLLPELLRQNVKMVFFCRNLETPEPIREAEAAGEIIVLKRPPTDDLVALYSMAEAFIFPSWIEGFGLPILEAMACGAPVIASNRGSIPQVAGNAALLIDAEDYQSLANCMSHVLSNSAETARLRELGYTRAALFSWDTAARHILSCYERIVEPSSS